MSKFSRMHYVEIARILRTSKTKADVKWELIKFFKADNPRFDAKRFKEAAEFSKPRPSARSNNPNPVSNVRAHPRKGTRGVRSHTRRRKYR